LLFSLSDTQYVHNHTALKHLGETRLDGEVMSGVCVSCHLSSAELVIASERQWYLGSSGEHVVKRDAVHFLLVR
jgi:hypothetical protein